MRHTARTEKVVAIRVMKNTNIALLRFQRDKGVALKSMMPLARTKSVASEVEAELTDP